MSEQQPGYEILSIDELQRYAPASGSPVLLTLGRLLGTRAFGINCWLGPEPGDQVIERHYERGGDEELYAVVRGRATFTVGGETLDAPAGTLVHVPPETLREAVAAEPGTIVFAAGAKIGEPYAPSGWEAFPMADALRREGRLDEARALVLETIARQPDAWQGPYNAACFEALAGNPGTAFEHLRSALQLDTASVRRYAATDSDFDSLRSDPRWAEMIG